MTRRASPNLEEGGVGSALGMCMCTGLRQVKESRFPLRSWATPFGEDEWLAEGGGGGDREVRGGRRPSTRPEGSGHRAGAPQEQPTPLPVPPLPHPPPALPPPPPATTMRLFMAKGEMRISEAPPPPLDSFCTLGLGWPFPPPFQPPVGPVGHPPTLISKTWPGVTAMLGCCTRAPLPPWPEPTKG